MYSARGRQGLEGRGTRRWGMRLVGGPGKAYEAQGGEIWMPLHHLYESGEYAEAADRGRELIEAHPEYAGPLYNLACCESLAGRTDDAIRHLRLAIDRKECSVRLLPGTATSTRSATRPLSRNSFRATQPSQPRVNRLRAGRVRRHSRTLAQAALTPSCSRRFRLSGRGARRRRASRTPLRTPACPSSKTHRSGVEALGTLRPGFATTAS